MCVCMASITDKPMANAMQNNPALALCTSSSYSASPVFAVTPRTSGTTACHRNITPHSYLTVHISSTLQDADTHTHALNSCQALKAMTLAESVEGVGVDRKRAGGGEGEDVVVVVGRETERACQG